MHERMTRLWAGAEAGALGHGGIAMGARATGLAISTVTFGRNEIRVGATIAGLVKVRRKGGGRKPDEVVHPELLPALEKLVDPVTRGDPESPLRWTGKGTRDLAVALSERCGKAVGARTVARLLGKLGYSLQATHKTRSPATCCSTLAAPATNRLSSCSEPQPGSSQRPSAALQQSLLPARHPSLPRCG
jgi:hypothetical protein